MIGKSLYPLGKVKEAVEAVGMGISYAHEDLVFLEHNAFLLRFTGSESEILVHRNIEAESAGLVGDLARLKAEGKVAGLVFTESCPFRLTPVDEANIRIEFIEQ
jgi:hypothetical protein